MIKDILYAFRMPTSINSNNGKSLSKSGTCRTTEKKRGAEIAVIPGVQGTGHSGVEKAVKEMVRPPVGIRGAAGKALDLRGLRYEGSITSPRSKPAA